MTRSVSELLAAYNSQVLLARAAYAEHPDHIDHQGGSPMSRTDDLAAIEAEKRAGREHRTAAAAAFRELARTGTGVTPAALARFAQSRIDGSTATLRDPGARPSSSSTNHADGVTSGYLPLESNREDY